MNLLSPTTIKSLCQKYKIRPQKKWGQNFLISRNVLDKIIKAADLNKDDVVLEIGPGFGALTVELAKRVKRVVAVEKDGKLIGVLKGALKGYENVEVVEGDILDKELFRCFIAPLLEGDTSRCRLQGIKYKIVANLPYQITSAVLRKFLENETKPKEMILMVQKEVGEKICSGPGKMSLLSVAVQFYAQPKILFKVSKNNFWPVPKVDSVVVRISTLPMAGVENRRHGQGNRWHGQHRKTAAMGGVEINEKQFFKIVKAGFSNKRRQLKNNLQTIFKDKDVGMILESIGLDSKIRAEELGVEDWIKLVNAFCS